MAGFTKAETNAKILGDAFDLNDLTLGAASFGTSATTDVITHGLTGTPDFVLATRAEGGDVLSYAANSTSVTFTRGGTTNNIEAYSYIIGDLA
jgi:hypothetical protein